LDTLGTNADIASNKSALDIRDGKSMANTFISISMFAFSKRFLRKACILQTKLIRRINIFSKYQLRRRTERQHVG